MGKVVPASFLQKTADVLPGIDRLHNHIEGIFKPAGASYALSVASMLKTRIEGHGWGSCGRGQYLSPRGPKSMLWRRAGEPPMGNQEEFAASVESPNRNPKLRNSNNF